MRILWVKAGKLLPVDSGGKIRSFNLLRQLAIRNKVTLLSYYGPDRDSQYEGELENFLPGSICLTVPIPTSTSAKARDFLGNLFTTAPYALARFTFRDVKERLAGLLEGNRFDVAVCDFLAPCLNFPAELKTPTVLFQHNVESALWAREAEHAKDLARRLAFRIEHSRIKRYETNAVRRFHHVIAVSENDKQLMSEMTSPDRITVVPTGVDLANYRPASESGNDHNNSRLVVFTGSMDWRANVDAMEYFCRDIWPEVQKDVPDAKLRIVGRDPDPRVLRLAAPSVEVTGTVASVVDHLREAAAVIVPLRIGGGTRLKIYEAMAMGKAVVSTSIGAEGLDVNHDRDILLADDPETFGKSVARLLMDQGYRRQIEHQAAAQAGKYDWSVVGRRFEEVLARTGAH